MNGNAELRRRLTEIVNPSCPKPKGHQRAAIQKLTAHTIEFVDPQPECSVEYTCLMHVLNFQNDERYIRIARLPGCENIYASPNFAHWLITTKKMQAVDPLHANNGYIIFYFDSSGWKHAGLWISNSRIISKWGPGYLWRHGEWEVPSNYGDNSFTFEPVSQFQASAWFAEYAIERGVPAECCHEAN